jgi:hypothetical protein
VYRVNSDFISYLFFPFWFVFRYLHQNKQNILTKNSRFPLTGFLNLFALLLINFCKDFCGVDTLCGWGIQGNVFFWESMKRSLAVLDFCYVFFDVYNALHGMNKILEQSSCFIGKVGSMRRELNDLLEILVWLGMSSITIAIVSKFNI